jgi:uncharacterized protein (DUF433 family)
MTATTTLERELYGVGEAARLLGLPSVTLRRWLDGDRRKGTYYEPVLRPEATHRDSVTWGEFVEAGLLREYRNRGVPLQKMRPVISRLREELGVMYPLAHARPYVSGKELVRAIQAEVGVDERLWVVITGPEGQLVLSDPAARFVEKVEFDDEIAQRLYPVGRDSLVSIDPLKSFGIPTVRGIRTENISELFRAGESVGAIAEAFDLGVTEVEAALRFEAA